MLLSVLQFGMWVCHVKKTTTICLVYVKWLFSCQFVSCIFYFNIQYFTGNMSPREYIALTNISCLFYIEG